VFTSGIETSFSNCWFGGNYATKYGGAVMAVYDFTSPTFSNCTFVGNHADRSGGAVLVDTHGTASFEDCTFLSNSCVEYGGGLGYRTAAHVWLTRCLFRGNVAWKEEDSWGGGLFGDSSYAATLIDCTFEDNACDDRGGGAFLWHDDIIIKGCTWTGNSVGFNGGGGLFLHGDSVVEDCAFIANTAPRGAGFWYHKDDSVLVSRCTMAGNIASDSGGGMRIDDDGVARLVDCCFVGNIAAKNGGAMMIDNTGTIAFLSNTTMTMNEAEVYGGGIFADVGELILANSVLWGNAASMPYDEWNQLYYEYGDVRLDYSCVEGWMGTYEGYGCIDADPLFVRTPSSGDDGVWGTHDDDYGDLHLQPNSPCVDAGANNALPADTIDLDEDGDTVERIPLDLGGNPRFADDPGTDDTGCGAPVIVDMGAYEFPGDAWHPMRIGDTDSDGLVNTADLLILLGAWGGYEDACILADLDLSGAVDADDLLSLLANWG
jgi:hypothetical protein